MSATVESPLFQNYRRAPVSFHHGRGVRLYDSDGREYLDFLAGIATSCLGHAHPRLVAAISEQAGRVLHVSNLYEIPEQEEAAALLLEAAGSHLGRAFFCNSGAEANEAAIKLARKWGDGRHEIVATDGGFHGRTLGALAATGTVAYRRPFEPLPPGFTHVPFNDLEAARSAVGERTCAVLVEPVQGEGGVIPASVEYLRGLETLCRDRQLLLILDEVQTGIGRSGSMFAFQEYGVEPDVVTLGKGLGGGVPVGAVLARAEVADRLLPGEHGTTFGGNQLASVAVATVLRTIREEGLLDRTRELGARLRSGLEQLGGAGGPIEEVRGLGLLLAARLRIQAAPVVAAALERGLLVNAVAPQVIRIAPPLIISTAEIDDGLSRLAEALEVVDRAS